MNNVLKRGRLSAGGIYITFDIRCQSLSVIFGEDGNTNVGRMFQPSRPYDSTPKLRPIRLSAGGPQHQDKGEAAPFTQMIRTDLISAFLYQWDFSPAILTEPRLSGGETIKYDGIHAVSVERSVNSDGRVMWNGDYGRDAVSDGVTGYRFDTRLSKK